ncbi:MAG: GWxTD domain-containing protein [Balneolaceae bacterium]|nr:MAG: GWxTD domain-containing protein [Balneolaceae bacterium]
MQRIVLPLAALLFLAFFDAEAQRRATTTYESLLQRTDQPSSYIDHIVIPDSDSTAQLAVFFRLDYDFIPFLRMRPNMQPPTPEAEFFAPVRMGVEVFQGPPPGSRRSSSPASVFRDSWQDTVWVNTFEDTKSRFDYTQGFVGTTLSSGAYHYELQLSRAGSVREQASTRRGVTLPKYSEFESASFYLLSDFTLTEDEFNATLLNFGSNVLYGQDYSLLVKLPSEGESLTLNKHLLGSGSGAEPGDIRFGQTISDENTIFFNGAEFHRTDGDVSLRATLADDGVRYAVIPVPNQDFENSRFRLRLMQDGKEDPIAERTINSQWIDMPVSLYNLDVAISMMRFIVSDEELRRINSGSASERERKFREFWAERDPTPETEFNELMAEFYSRIDSAFRNFSSLQTPGFDTDQGRAYILFGAPDNIERRLPANAPAREIWQYPNRTLIFEATTGFGDFRLISES